MKLDKGRVCFSCLKPKNICKSRICANESIVPEILKCAICASWAESKGLVSFSIFFCKRKEHGDSRAPLVDLKRKLERYIGKLGTTIVDSSTQFAVNFMFQILCIFDHSASSHDRVQPGSEDFPSCTIYWLRDWTPSSMPE